MLHHRLAVLMVIMKNRYGDDWNPWSLDATYDDEGSIGDEIAQWTEYRTAQKIINHWMKKIEKDDE
jgi:hypothetical protein